MTGKNILSIFITATFLAVPLSAQELTIYTENNPPASYMENGKLQGTAVTIVRRILQTLKRPDTIELVPWARGYSLALKKPCVALFSTTRLPQRENRFKWVGPIYSQTWILYKKRGSTLSIRSLQDARAVDRIGTYHKDAKKLFLEKLGFQNLVSVSDNTTNVHHLISGNIDLWISSDFNMPYIAGQAGIPPDQIEKAFVVKTVDNYIAFSIGTPDRIIRAWQSALDNLNLDPNPSE